MGAHMERRMQRMGKGKDVPESRRVRAQPEPSSDAGTPRSAGKGCWGCAAGKVRSAAVRPSGDRGGFEGEGPGRLFPAHQRANREGCESSRRIVRKLERV